MTPNEAVTKGLQKIGVIAAGEVPTGQETTDGIELLHQMLNMWELDGVNLQNYDVASGDQLPFPKNHDIAIIYNFAVFAAPEYQTSASNEVVAIASGSMRLLRNAYLDPNVRASLDKSLLPYYSANESL